MRNSSKRFIDMPEYHMKYFTYTNLDGYKMLQCVNKCCIYTDFSAILTTLLLPKTKISPYHHNLLLSHKPPPPHSSIKRSKYIQVEKEYKALSNQYLVKLFDLKGEFQDS